MACEDCLEICFVGIVVERTCVWCLVLAAIFMGSGQTGEKRCAGCWKVIDWEWRCKSQKVGSFHREGRFSLVILLYCETLLQVLLCIYCKRFYWITLFTILQLFYVFEVGKAESATQSVLMKHWMGYSRKSFLPYSWKFIILNPTPFPCFVPL